MLRKNSIERNFVLLFILISLIPIILISTCSILITVITLRRQAEQETQIQLKSVDNAVYEKTKKIQRFIDNISVSDELIALLDHSSDDIAEFEEVMDRLSRGNDEIKGVIFENKDKKIYSYKISAENFDRLAIISAGMSREPGTITWYNIDDYSAHAGVGENLMMVTMTLNRFFRNDEYKLISNVYIFINKSTFEDIISSLSDNNIICILDEKGKLVSSNKKEEYTDIESDIDIMTKIFSQSDGLFETESNGRSYLFSHYSSTITGFKFIKIYDAKEHYKGVYSIAFMCVMLIVVLLIAVILVYIVISKRITAPIKALSNTMKNFNGSSLYTKLPIQGTDEVAMITAGFNKMTEQIHIMIENAKTREREKKDADFRALRYQINPHFLYNTLATIRIMAIKNGQKEISDIMLVLNRVLKNAFSRTDKFVPLGEEMDLVKDYAELLNMRYQNQLGISYDIQPQAIGCYVPTMLIQPLVENAVMHGLSKRLASPDKSAKVCVRARVMEECLMIEVYDNGIGMSEEDISRVLMNKTVSRHGVGIYNIKERIEILFGGEYGLKIKSEPGEYTVIILKLPLRYDNDQSSTETIG